MSHSNKVPYIKENGFQTKKNTFIHNNPIKNIFNTNQYIPKNVNNHLYMFIYIWYKMHNAGLIQWQHSRFSVNQQIWAFIPGAKLVRLITVK